MHTVAFPPQAHVNPPHYAFEDIWEKSTLSDKSMRWPFTNTRSPVSCPPSPSIDRPPSYTSLYSEKTLIPYPITSHHPPRRSSLSHFIGNSLLFVRHLLRAILTTLFVFALYILAFGIIGTLWSCVCGYLGWGVLSHSDRYNLASHSGIWQPCAVGGAIFGGIWGLIRFIVACFEDEDVTQRNLVAREVTTFFICVAIGVFGQCVGSGVLIDKVDGMLSVGRAILASGVGEIFMAIPLAIILASIRTNQSVSQF